MKKSFRVLAFSTIAAALTAGAALHAQGRQELGVSAGAGSMIANGKGSIAPVFSLSYRFHFTHHMSAEGALDTFSWEYETGSPVEPLYRDGYEGAEAALVYSLRDNRKTGEFIPFIATGIGKTSTDFTEIPATVYYRAGGGFSYHFTEKLGLRAEIRNESVARLFPLGSRGNLPSARIGFVYRF